MCLLLHSINFLLGGYAGRKRNLLYVSWHGRWSPIGEVAHAFCQRCNACWFLVDIAKQQSIVTLPLHELSINYLYVPVMFTRFSLYNLLTFACYVSAKWNRERYTITFASLKSGLEVIAFTKIGSNILDIEQSKLQNVEKMSIEFSTKIFCKECRYPFKINTANVVSNSSLFKY